MKSPVQLIMTIRLRSRSKTLMVAAAVAVAVRNPSQTRRTIFLKILVTYRNVKTKYVGTKVID